MTAVLYVNSQDWLLTFVLSDYMGWAYVAYVGVLFAVLFDLVFLPGILTQAVVNAVGALVPPFPG